MSGCTLRELAIDGVQRAPVRMKLAARPEEVGVVRQVLSGVLDQLGVEDAALVEDIKVAVTEACSNAVRHAYPAGRPGTMEVSLLPHGRELVVWVSDEGRGMSGSPERDGRGLGLTLIAMLASRILLGGASSGGTTLVMAFALDGSERPVA